MKLKQYRQERNIPARTFAKKVLVSVQHIYEIERGVAFPSRSLARRIAKSTKNMVTERELLFPDDAA